MKHFNRFKKYGAGVGLLSVSGYASAADLATLKAAILAKIGEAETFGYELLVVGLVATLGIVLIRRWAKKGIG